MIFRFLKKWIIYEYWFFRYRRNESPNMSWFSAILFISILSTIVTLSFISCFLNVDTKAFFLLKNNFILTFVFLCIINYCLLFFNKSFKKFIIQEADKSSKKNWKYWWIFSLAILWGSILLLGINGKKTPVENRKIIPIEKYIEPYRSH